MPLIFVGKIRKKQKIKIQKIKSEHKTKNKNLDFSLSVRPMFIVGGGYGGTACNRHGKKQQ